MKQKKQKEEEEEKTSTFTKIVLFTAQRRCSNTEVLTPLIKYIKKWGKKFTHEVNRYGFASKKKEKTKMND